MSKPHRPSHGVLTLPISRHLKGVMSAPAHGMRGKRNAAKPDAEKVTGKGQIMLYAGDLKAQVQAVLKPRQSISDWVREAIQEKLDRLN